MIKFISKINNVFPNFRKESSSVFFASVFQALSVSTAKKLQVSAKSIAIKYELFV